MIYQISSGQGPAECELGVAKLIAYLQNNYGISVLETSPGYYEGTFRSARFFTEEDLSPVCWFSQVDLPQPLSPRA